MTAVLMVLTAIPEVLGVLAGVYIGDGCAGYATAGGELRASMRQLWWTRWTWRRLARAVGLCYKDPIPRLRPFPRRRMWPEDDLPRIVLPRIRLTADEYGVVLRTKTLPKIGRLQWEAECEDLADAWRCARVAVTQEKPGRLVVRAVRRDPLTVPTTWVPTMKLPDLGAWPLVWTSTPNP